MGWYLFLVKPLRQDGHFFVDFTTPFKHGSQNKWPQTVAMAWSAPPRGSKHTGHIMASFSGATGA